MSMFEKYGQPRDTRDKNYLYTSEHPCIPLLSYFISIALPQALPWSTFMIQHACYNVSLVHLVPPTACSVPGDIATGLERS